MKKLSKMALTAFLFVISVLFASCTKDLEDRVKKVEDQVGKLITDVASLQSELDKIDPAGSTVAMTKDATTGRITITTTNPTNTITFDGDKSTAVGSVVTVEEGVPTAGKTTITVDGEEYVFVNTIPEGENSATLSGMLFIPTIIDNGVHAIDQGYINEIDAQATNTRLDNKVMFNWQNVQFRVNPTNSNVATTTFSFVNTQSIVRTRATSDETSLYKAPTEKAAFGEGAYAFKLDVKTWSEPAADKAHLFALNGKLADGVEVMSDYVKVVPQQYHAFIQNKTLSSTVYADATKDYPVLFSTCKELTHPADFEIQYNSTIKTNLNTLVLDVTKPIEGTNLNVRKTFADYRFEGYTFRFTNVSYTTTDDTDHSTFIQVETNGDITVLRAEASIDRLPIVKAEIVSPSGKVVAIGFIKFKIVRKTGDVLWTKEVTTPILYKDMFTGDALSQDAGDEYNTNITPIAITWDEMNTIYTQLGVSHNEFRTIYGTAPTFDPLQNTNADAIDRLTWSTADPNVESFVMKYGATPYSKFGQNIVKYVFTPNINDGTRPKLTIVFKYTVVKPVLFKNILASYRYNEDPNTVNILGMKVGAADYQMQAYLGEAFNNGNASTVETGYIGYRQSFTARPETGLTNTEIGIICGAKHQFAFHKVYASPSIAAMSNIVGGNTSTANSSDALTLAIDGQAKINDMLGTNLGTGALINLVDLLTTETRTYEVDFNTLYVNGEIDTRTYNVRFENPLTIVLSDEADFGYEKLAAGNTRDLAKNYIVKLKTDIIAEKGSEILAAAPGYVLTSDYVKFNDADKGLFYTLGTSIDNYQFSQVAHGTITPLAKSPMIRLGGEGTVVAPDTHGGNLTVEFRTTFAVAKRTDKLIINPTPKAK